MRNKDVEILRYLLFQEKEGKYKYLGCIGRTSNKSYAIDSDESVKLNRTIAKVPKCNMMIKIHNHPHIANAIPSKADDLSALAEFMGLKALGVELYDDCIISGIDFYSRRQDEEKRKKHRIIRKQKYSDKFLKKVLKENKPMAYLMSKAAAEI